MGINHYYSHHTHRYPHPSPREPSRAFKSHGIAFGPLCASILLPGGPLSRNRAPHSDIPKMCPGRRLPGCSALSARTDSHAYLPSPRLRHSGKGENDKNGKSLAGLNDMSETHRVLPLCVFPLSLSVCLCAGVSQRESQVAQSPLASLRALWLSPARSPGLECLVPAGALPPLPRLLPLHFSLSPPPSLPPPFPMTVWAVQKPHALFIYFPGWRAGDALRGAGA